MKSIYKTMGAGVLSLALLLTGGCVNPNGTQNNTGTDALVGGAFGALVGAAAGGRHAGEGALIGALAGAAAGGLIGSSIDAQQNEMLRAQYPQTYYKIQNNEAVASGAYPPPPPPPPGTVVTPPLTPPPGAEYATSPAPAPDAAQPPPSSSAAPQPPPAAPASPAAQPQLQQFTLDDIKALTAAGVKADVINKEIEVSHSTFSAADITAAQQSNPPIDPTVIAYMQSHRG